MTLTIERHYGSRGSVQVRYITFSHTALGALDYMQIEPGAFGAVNLDDGQTTAQIFIDILPDSFPEEDEQFYVNLTSVTKLPTIAAQGISPRLSEFFHTACITIAQNNNPYGILSIEAMITESDGKATEPSAVVLKITRTGESGHRC